MLDERLLAFVSRHSHLFVLTGAGCSTGSGIPDYRDRNGDWKRPAPVDFQSFCAHHHVRQRYWARSLVGWQHFGRARPNPAHQALRDLESCGRLSMLVTQNVDGLHQAAGHRNVIDLHGRLDRIRCLQCGLVSDRTAFQQHLSDANPGWSSLQALQAPDGDADLEGIDFSSFEVPQCNRCGGLLKPDVVFYGENVPRPRLALAMDALQSSDAVLVVGSSLMVLSGLRFVRNAVQMGLPVAAINLGRTRADDLISLKIEQTCTDALPALAERLISPTLAQALPTCPNRAIIECLRHTRP